jgi:hypothetical protein
MIRRGTQYGGCHQPMLRIPSHLLIILSIVCVNAVSSRIPEAYKLLISCSIV